MPVVWKKVPSAGGTKVLCVRLWLSPGAAKMRATWPLFPGKLIPKGDMILEYRRRQIRA